MRRYIFRPLTTSDHDAISQVEQLAEWLGGNAQERIRAGSICMVAIKDRQVRGL
jgi:hypothetical protein